MWSSSTASLSPAAAVSKTLTRSSSVSPERARQSRTQLVGAWEIYVGNDSRAAVWRLRECDNLATREAHCEKAMADASLRSRNDNGLYPTLDFVDTTILRLATFPPTSQAS